MMDSFSFSPVVNSQKIGNSIQKLTTIPTPYFRAFFRYVVTLVLDVDIIVAIPRLWKSDD